jgi:hypothetical protein
MPVLPRSGSGGGSGATVYNVKVTYGASGLGVLDDGPEIQAAINACSAAGGGIVFFPNGTYSVGQGAGFYCLSVPSGVMLLGESRNGVILKQAVVGDSVRLLYITGTEPVISNLTLDGNKANNTTQEHRHGIFAETTTRMLVIDVTTQNFTGDGFFLYNDANDSTFFNCFSTGNERNGFTFGGAGQNGCKILGGRFYDSAIQQIDSEPGGSVTNVSINNVYIGAGSSNDFALTCSGASRIARNDKWAITNCVIDGAVSAVWTDNISFANNRGSSGSTDKPHLMVYRTCRNVSLSNNHWKSTANAAADKAVIYIVATDNVNGDQPSNVSIVGDTVTNTLTNGQGIYASGAVDVKISNCTVIGPGTVGTGFGIYLRSTLDAWPVRNYIASNNTVKNWGTAALAFAGSGTATVLAGAVTGNTFDSDTASVQTIGMYYDVDGLNALLKATAYGNICTGFCVTEALDYPVGGVVLIGGNWGERGIYSTTGDPGGVVTEKPGAMALSRGGGASTTLYVKESGSDTTAGWVAK